MTELTGEDSLTKLNTQLNKSMVLMDSTMESENDQIKSNKSIKINTKIQPASASTASPNTSRKSILKKNDKKATKSGATIKVENVENAKQMHSNVEHRTVPIDVLVIPRPQNLEDLIQEETLIHESNNSTFSIDDLSDSEDIWIMDIPRTVNPQELRGQKLVLGEKSKFKIKEERYCTVNHSVKCNVTCVFNSGKVKPRYKTVNIKPAGGITIRRKLSGIPKIKPIEVETTGVPFPKNLKIRHPLFGVSHEGLIRKGTIKKFI